MVFAKEDTKKYLQQQIVALSMYSKVAWKGYQITKDGFQFINDAKNGELNLHQGYFSSLRAVNPKIRNLEKVKEIRDMQTEILNRYKTTWRQVRSSVLYSSEEKASIATVYDGLLTDCEQVIDELTPIITPGEAEMTDDERIERIDKLHADMTTHYTFSQSIASAILKLADQRGRAKQELSNLRALHGKKITP